MCETYINLLIFECEGVRLFSGEFALTKVNNDKEMFERNEIFREGDFIDENSFMAALEKVKSDHIKFKVRVIDLDFSELYIYDIEEISSE